MPELPDVEGFKDHFDKTSLNKKIKSVEAESGRILKDVTVKKLQQRLKGEKFKSSYRHGKYFFAETGSGCLALHFGMTGFLKYYKDDKDKPAHPRMTIHFENGHHLAYDNLRKFGSIRLIDNINDFIKEKKLGQDPVNENISLKIFKELFKKRSGAVKTRLMDQEILAGIGNIYADEILFHAGIHPASDISNLDDNDLKIIHREMKSILKKAIKVNIKDAKFLEDFLIKHRRPGKDCPRCSGKIKKQTIGGRSSYFCGKHQEKK